MLGLEPEARHACNGATGSQQLSHLAHQNLPEGQPIHGLSRACIHMSIAMHPFLAPAAPLSRYPYRHPSKGDHSRSDMAIGCQCSARTAQTSSPSMWTIHAASLTQQAHCKAYQLHSTGIPQTRLTTSCASPLASRASAKLICFSSCRIKGAAKAFITPFRCRYFQRTALRRCIAAASFAAESWSLRKP